MIRLGIACSLAVLLACSTAHAKKPSAGINPTRSLDNATSASEGAPDGRDEARAWKARSIRALMEGTLDPSVDPHELFVVDLLSDQAEREKTQASKGPPGATAPDPLFEARSEFLGLPSETRESLLLAHFARQLQLTHDAMPPEAETSEKAIESEVQTANARDDKQAIGAGGESKDAIELASSEKQASESRRLLSEERAHLLKLRRDLETEDQELDALESSIEASRERALAWHLNVSRAMAATSDVAEITYDELVDALKGERELLDRALQRVSSKRGTNISDADLRPDLPLKLDRSELDQLVDNIVSVATLLDSRREELHWLAATTLRDSVVLMNRDRLRLLPHLSESRRAELRGFGPDGIAQARRELNQMALEVRYRSLSLPRSVDKLASSLGSRPVNTLLLAARLFILVLLFRFWRRRGTRFLGEWRGAWLSRPRTRLTHFVSGFFWYWQRVRGPLDWLGFFGLVGWLLPLGDDFPELGLLWHIVFWALLGAFVIRLVDAMAARQPNQRADDAAKLRYRSLRIVGVVVVVLGLVLSITRALVGEGAIHTWVWRSCWVLALPIAVLLFVWWRPVIRSRARAHPSPNWALTWSMRNHRGFWAPVATFVGGLALLFEGLVRWTVRQASHLALTRRVLAHLFRRDVERRAAAVDESMFQPLPQETTSQLLGGQAELHVEVGEKRLRQLADSIHKEPSRLVAVVGEKGLGKSRFLLNLGAKLEELRGEGTMISVACKPGGYEAFLQSLAQEVGLEPEASEDEVAAQLRATEPLAILVDDAHMLIKPLIGGLHDIDKMVAFAQGIGFDAPWAVGINAPSWRYLRRARGDRAIFDEVIQLPSWTEDEIRMLAMGIAKSAGVDARLDELVVPRQMYEAQYSDQERVERDFSRILWDYSDGNPGVAAHFWLQSLALKNDEVFVRLFKPPSVLGLEELPGALHFVLRAIVQLELATEQDIAKCTDLPMADVADALRLARSRGYTERVDGYVRIHPHWFRAVTRFLRRQHLLVA